MKRKFRFLFVVLLATAFFFVLHTGARADTAVSYTVRQTEVGYELIETLPAGERTAGTGQTLAETLARLSSLPEGGHLRFENITSATGVQLPAGRYRLSGTACFTADATLTIGTGSDVTFTDGDLRFGENGNPGTGCLRVKDGCFTLLGGSITGGTRGAIVTDYAAGAVVRIRGGSVTSPAPGGTVIHTMGTLEIDGGSVTGTAGAAISVSSTCRLSGHPDIHGRTYDVEGACPLTLSIGNSAFSGEISVRTGTLYRRGQGVVAFYGALAGNTGKIELFDKNGDRVPLSWFSSAAFTEEENFLAVYLPYTVSFRVGDKLLGTADVLAGQSPSLPVPPGKEGYTFAGWCYDPEGTALIGDGFVPTEDVTLYAAYRLTPPAFLLSSLTFTYDGVGHTFGLSALTHPLAADGVFSFRWYRDGEVTAYATPTFPVTAVTDSGSYSCVITFHVGADGVTVATPAVTVTVEKMTVALPDIPDAVYTGEKQAGKINVSDLYTIIENNGGIHAGEYPVILKLTDPVNTKFPDTDEDIVHRIFRILRAENRFTVPPSVADVFAGRTPLVRACAVFGTPEFLYASAATGNYTAEVPVTPGLFYLVTRVAGTSDYTELLSDPLPFTVLERKVTGLSVESAPTRTAYTAFETFDPAGLIVRAGYNDGTSEWLPLSALTFAYQRGVGYFTYGENGIVIRHGEAAVTLPVQVEKASYDLSGLDFSDTTVIYNGQFLTVRPGGTAPVGKDGIPLLFSLTGGGTDTGTYIVTLTFYTDSTNYKTPAPLTCTLTVAPCPVSCVFGTCDFVYDGTPKLPAATAKAPDGTLLPLTVTGESVCAGSYTAIATSDNPNYVLMDATCTFLIRRARYDLSGARWETGDFVFDGTEHRVTLVGLPDGVRVVGYKDATAIGAGAYTAEATLAYDERNYEPPVVPPCSWRVARATFSLDGVSFPAATYVFDGKVHYPTLLGTLPRGKDGSTLTLVFDRGATHVSEGVVTVTVRLVPTGENYEEPAPLTATVEILPAPVPVSWDNLTFIYDGREHLPRATAAIPLTVTGGASGAGTYTAVAASQDSDYILTGARVTFVIEKAANRWLLPLTVADLFAGRHPAPQARAEQGEARIFYYADAAATEEIAVPTEPGTYYAVARVTGLDNYTDIVSVPVAFRIIAVVPVGITVELRQGELTARSRLCGADFTAALICNDGSRVPLSASAVTVGYPAGDCLHFGDTRLTFSAEGFYTTVPVTVKKATVPTSAIRLSPTTLVYNGEEQTLSVLSLPEGIGVDYIRGASFLGAGVYTVLLGLTFDPRDYENPGVLSITVTVEKRKIPLPALPSVVYNGNLLTSGILSTADYTVSADGGGVHAGSYPVLLTLTDPDNTVFADGGDSTVLAFRILPRPLSVTVEDVLLYLDSRTPDFSYRVTEGSAVAGDRLGFVPRMSGNTVSAVFENPDYAVLVTPGTVRHVARLSPARRGSAGLCVLGIVLLLLMLFLLIRYRHVLAEKLRLCRRTSPVPQPLPAAVRNLWEEPEGTLTLHTPARTPADPPPAPPVVNVTATAAPPTEEKPHATPVESPAGETSLRITEPEIVESAHAAFTLTKKAEMPASAAEVSAPSSQTGKSGPAAEEPPVPAAGSVPGREESTESLPASGAEMSARPDESTVRPVAEVFRPETTMPAEETVTEETVPEEVQQTEEDLSDTSSEELCRAARAVDVQRADDLITDGMARGLFRAGREVIRTYGYRRSIVNVDTLSEHFEAGERVDVNILKYKCLIPYDTGYLKILARGVLDKPLTVYATDFSLPAVKMIALTGGEAHKVRTEHTRRPDVYPLGSKD